MYQTYRSAHGNTALRISTEVVPYQLLVDLVVSGGVRQASPSAKEYWLSVQISRGRTKKSICVSSTQLVLTRLGLPERSRLPPSSLTPKLKKGAISYLVNNLPIETRFYALSYWMETHLTLSVNSTRPQTRYYISDVKGYLRKLLDSLGFRYTTFDKGGMLNITQGSFFINGRWIHIG